jgi:hypothetical protein
LATGAAGATAGVAATGAVTAGALTFAAGVVVCAKPEAAQNIPTAIANTRTCDFIELPFGDTLWETNICHPEATTLQLRIRLHGALTEAAYEWVTVLLHSFLPEASLEGDAFCVVQAMPFEC